MQNVTEKLKNIGLSEKEALVYTTLLKYGSATVSTISRNANIKRPTTYVVLDELRKKGLVIEVPNKKKIIYHAKSPDDFYEQQLNKFKDFESIIPQLKSIHSDRKEINTLYFEGFNGLKEALFYKLGDLSENSENFGFWSSAEGVDKKVIDLTYDWNKELIKKNIKLTGYTTSDKETDVYKDKFKSDVKFLPKDVYESETSIDITDLFIRIIDLHDQSAVIIENPRLAKTFKTIFEFASSEIENKIKSDLER